jgi:hypothetical protein
MAVLSCTAFTATPAAAETHAPGRDLRLFLITVGDKAGLLKCGPRYANRPACVTLDRVGGDPSRLTMPSDTACTMEYDPVRVRAMGIWDGQRHDYDHTFSNSCELAASTGDVFQF